MKTRQMSMLRVLSVMVLLLFAAPMMDGVLTLSQSQNFGETTIFETSVYAHPENPSVGQEHTHKIKEYWEKCTKCTAGVERISKIAVFAVWIGASASGNGGSGQQTVEMVRQADRQTVVATKECPKEDGGNDGGNDGN